ncbi:MAG: CHAP domain-containing protein [Betaproteobacteria bacterium]|nr:CHAP domain-containing protein [Betaproteobacteria bacterium]
MKRKFFFVLSVLILAAASFMLIEKNWASGEHEIGTSIDSFNGVHVYYNGPISNVSGRNLTDNNYNLGLKYQCVEFVKRYYYEHYRHKMPDSYGHAKDFFDDGVRDGEINKKRDLIQYRNPSQSSPKVGDLVIFDGHIANRYGHVAIISAVEKDKIEIIQQNPGPREKSRINIPLSFRNGLWRIGHGRTLGWLRKEGE